MVAFLKSNSSTPDVLVELGFAARMRSIQKEESSVIRVGWPIKTPVPESLFFIKLPTTSQQLY